MDGMAAFYFLRLSAMVSQMTPDNRKPPPSLGNTIQDGIPDVGQVTFQ